MTQEHTAAHRPPSVRSWRLVPLALLVMCVAVAAAIGALHGGRVSAGEAPPGPDLLRSQAKILKQAMREDARRRSACLPPFANRHGEPWVRDARPASQARFATRVAQENSNYVKGKGGWLFFSDRFNRNFSQALGRSVQSRAREKAWATYIQKQRTAAAAAGADFRIVVAPANWDIYPTKLPTWAQQLRGSTSLEHLLRDYPDLPWIDTRAALSKAARQHPTYQPLDSHWTAYGGWVAWRSITRCLRTDPELASLREPPLTGVGVGPSSNEFSSYGVADGRPASTYPIFAASHPDSSTTHIPDGGPVPLYPDGSVDQLYSPVRTVTPQALSPLSLLVLRDSTGNALSPLWNWTFAETVSYRHDVDSGGSPDVASLVRTHRPDVVLFIMTERFLFYAPPRR